jgi:hypothetical protein
LGLSTLRDLILRRASCRSDALRVVLGFSRRKEESLRSPAIRLITNKLFHLESLAGTIEMFATDLLNSMSEIQDEVEKEKETELDEDLQSKMLLYFALCTRKPELLERLISVYAETGPAVRRSIHRHAPGLIRTIGMQNPQLLRLISNATVASGQFILQILYVLSEKGLLRLPVVVLAFAFAYAPNSKANDRARECSESAVRSNARHSILGSDRQRLAAGRIRQASAALDFTSCHSTQECILALFADTSTITLLTSSHSCQRPKQRTKPYSRFVLRFCSFFASC